MGFTLMELMVVIALISMFFAFAIPKIHSGKAAVSQRAMDPWLIAAVRQLNHAAGSGGDTLALFVNPDTNLCWIAPPPDPDSPEPLTPPESPVSFDDDVDIMDVEMMQSGPVTTAPAIIRFYPGGYSDGALIHVREDETLLTYRLHPFSTDIDILEDYISYGN